MASHHLHSLRVAYENWHDEERFSHLLRLLREYPCGITQIALFTSATHAPLALAEHFRRVSIIKERILTVKAMGLSAGINILTTIGHHCEDLDAGLGDQYTYMTDIDGNVCKGSYCMRNPRYHEEYVIPCYTAMANAAPDFIWVDDDVRYGHMDIGAACFCNDCVASFNEKLGTSYTREELKILLNQKNVPLRVSWLKHNSDAISGLFRVIGQTVRAVDPCITLGFMTGERYFEGYRFSEYADALSDGGKYEIMWRPGGGAYVDSNYDAILEKQEQIGRQSAYLPDYVTLIHSEIENFPYQLLKKTPKSTAMEAAMSMTVGCTGAAFNILPSETVEPLDTVIPHLKAINRLTEFYRTEQDLLHGLTPEGIHTGWRIDSQAALPEGSFLNGYGGSYAGYNRELFSFGLPECYHKDKANVVTLTGESASVMENDEIRQMLSGGVYLDASALEYLRERGFGDAIGFAAGDRISVDARECYTAHSMNEGIAGGIRNCRQAFNRGDSFAIRREATGAQSLASLIDYHDREWCDCTLGIYENSFGGKICAAGYYPYSWVSDYMKTVQLKRLFVWLSDGTLPSFVESYHRIRNITLTGDGRMCVTLFNSSNDDLNEVRVAVRTKQTEAELVTMYNGRSTLVSDKKDGNYRYFSIDRIPPYEGVILSLWK